MRSNLSQMGGSGESPERSGPASQDVSLAAQMRRKLAEAPQLPLFSDRRAYQSYREYCESVALHSPPDFETWKRNSRILFGPNRLAL